MTFLEDNGYDSTIAYLDNSVPEDTPDDKDASDNKPDNKESYGYFWGTVYWMKFW